MKETKINKTERASKYTRDISRNSIRTMFSIPIDKSVNETKKVVNLPYIEGFGIKLYFLNINPPRIRIISLKKRNKKINASNLTFDKNV